MKRRSRSMVMPSLRSCSSSLPSPPHLAPAHAAQKVAPEHVRHKSMRRAADSHGTSHPPVHYRECKGIPTCLAGGGNEEHGGKRQLRGFLERLTRQTMPQSKTGTESFSTHTQIERRRATRYTPTRTSWTADIYFHRALGSGPSPRVGSNDPEGSSLCTRRRHYVALTNARHCAEPG